MLIGDYSCCSSATIIPHQITPINKMKFKDGRGARNQPLVMLLLLGHYCGIILIWKSKYYIP